MEPIWRPESSPESLDLEDFHTRLAIRKIHAALDRTETRLTIEEAVALWPRDEWSGRLIDADDPIFSAALDKRVLYFSIFTYLTSDFIFLKIEQWANQGKNMEWNKCQQLRQPYTRVAFSFESAVKVGNG